MVQRLSSFGRFSAVGLISWNGGGVTEFEIMRPAKLGWLTIVVRVSDRKTDEIATRLAVEDPPFLAILPACT